MTRELERKLGREFHKGSLMITKGLTRELTKKLGRKFGLS